MRAMVALLQAMVWLLDIACSATADIEKLAFARALVCSSLQMLCTPYLASYCASYLYLLPLLFIAILYSLNISWHDFP